MKPLLTPFVVRLAWFLILVGDTGWAAAQPMADGGSLSAELRKHIHQLVLDKVTSGNGMRAEIQVGQLDARLKLAPCEKIEPYLPSGSSLRGASRVGLRCLEGPTRWNVYLPITVSLYGQGLIATQDLPAGHVIEATDLRLAEIDLSQSRSPAWTEAPRVLGRVLAHPVGSGQALRQDALKPRQWFAAGDPVQIRASGGGFTVVGTAEALSAGMDGQMAKVRTENGKVLSGRPVAERLLEVDL